MPATNKKIDLAESFIGKREIDSALRVFAPFLLLLLAGLYMASVNQYWKPEWDSAYFLTLAKSMFEGKGFTYLSYPCLKVPFGFPLLLCPLLWLFDSNFLALNLVMTGIALLSLWVLYKYFSGVFSKEYATVIAFLTGTSYLMIYYSGYIMSDTSYLLFSLLALLFTHGYLHGKPGAFRYGVAAALCLLACYFMRTIGIALMLGILVALIFNKSYLLRLKQLAFLALLILIPISAWVTWSRFQHPDHDDPVWHLAEFVTSKETFMRKRYDQPDSRINGVGDLAKRGIQNVAYYTGRASMTVFSKRIEISMSDVKTFPKSTLWLLGIPASIMALGYLLNLKRGKDACDFYVLFYLGILLSWPAREERYLLPIVPFIFHYFLSGLIWLTARMQALLVPWAPYAKWFSSIILVSFCCFLGFSNLKDDFRIIRSQHTNPYYSSEIQQLMDVTQWVRQNTDKDTRIVSVNAPVVAFFGQRWCVSFPWVDDQFVILKMLEKVGAKYVIISPQLHDEQNYLIPILRDNPSIFQLRYAKAETSVFEVEEEALHGRVSGLSDAQITTTSNIVVPPKSR
jgi:hypothetical protein